MSALPTSRPCSSTWTMGRRATLDARKSHAAPGRVCPALSSHDPSGLLPSFPQQIQSHRTRLRDFGAALEWRLAGFARGRDGSHASTMTWKGKHPVVALVLTPYQTGVKLTKKAMEGIETQLQRLPHLDKWFVDIGNPSPALWENYSCLSS